VREECLTRLLFETGARISELTGLTLGDWTARGATNEAQAFNKGSRYRRVKFVRFSKETAKLLRRYVDTDRAALDRHGSTLHEYQQWAERGLIDLHTVPLFLSQQRTPWSAKAYRDHYWNPACRLAGLDADVHQARHWYVTQAIDTIYRSASTPGEIERQKRDLIEYMKWASGEETMKAYLHLYDAARHAVVQDAIHTSLTRALQAEETTTERGRQPTPGTAHPGDEKDPGAPGPLDAAYTYLLRLGGSDAGHDHAH
jgi:integrase